MHHLNHLYQFHSNSRNEIMMVEEECKEQIILIPVFYYQQYIVSILDKAMEYFLMDNC